MQVRNTIALLRQSLILTRPIPATWQGNCPVPDPTANLVDCIIPDDLAIYQLESGQDLAADQHTIQLSDIAILELRDSTTALPYPAWLVGYAPENPYLVGSDAQSKWALEGSDVRQSVQFLLEWNAAETPATIWPPTPFDYFSWRSSSDGLADDDNDTRQRIAEEDDKLPRFTDIYVPNYRAIAVGCFRPHLSRNLLSTEEEGKKKTVPAAHDISVYPGMAGAMTCAFQGRDMSEPKVVGYRKHIYPTSLALSPSLSLSLFLCGYCVGTN